MGTKEYILKCSKGKLDKQMTKKLMETEEIIKDTIGYSESEAIQIGRIICLPDNPETKPYSILKIRTPQKVKIDYIKKVDNEVLQEHLKSLQEANALSQGTLRKVTSKFNEVQKELKNQEKTIENLINQMDTTVKNIVDEEKIKEYLRNMEKYCDQLIDGLQLEKPYLLNDIQKEEVINKLDILIKNVADFRRNF